MKVDLAALGNWIHSWVQPSGAIHGFNNHTVWGSNPYRWLDYWAGHSTWSSPFLGGLSLALSKRMDEKGLALLRRLLHFQTESFQPSGLYKHIGFETGETLQEGGLIHNAMCNVSLGLTALHGRNFLPTEDMERIYKAIEKNMETCKRFGDGRATEHACCNQDYARIWAKLLFQIVYKDDRWKSEIIEDLDFMMKYFSVNGLPDEASDGTYRALGEASVVEPAEYYGLMIAPLILAYEEYGDVRYLHQAGRFCRHIARSAWIDDRGQTRFHRFWYLQEESWTKLNSPMLIAGMGMTLHSIRQYLVHQPHDQELVDFVSRCDATYAYYQTPRGYFVSATGWQSELDLAPCTSWHAHDFYYLVAHTELPPNFWTNMAKPYSKVSVLLGEQCIWVESGNHWSVADYFYQDVFNLLGKKDETRFGREMGWVAGPNKLPEHLRFPDLPVFVKLNDRIIWHGEPRKDVEVYNMTALPFSNEVNL